jgi:hypothetical protein
MFLARTVAGFTALLRWRKACVEEALVVGVPVESGPYVGMAGAADLASDESTGLDGVRLNEGFRGGRLRRRSLARE